MSDQEKEKLSDEIKTVFSNVLMSFALFTLLVVILLVIAIQFSQYR